MALSDSQTRDIRWALGEYRDDKRQLRYRLSRRYYVGDHQLDFARSRFNKVFGYLFNTVVDNLCPAVVDSINDRLNVTSFQSADSAVESPVAKRAWELWESNQMGKRASEVHREALMTGDGYAIVWPDPSTGNPVVWPQLAHEMAIAYDPNQPGRVLRASKLWLSDEDQRIRLNLYYPDRIEKYQSRQAATAAFPIGEMKERSFEPIPALRQAGISDATLPLVEITVNPYGQVPVFHFPNRGYAQQGLSDLLDVIPLQDALNKAVADMLVAMEYASFKQRWVVGLSVDVDDATGKPTNPPFEPGIDRIFAAEDPNVQFGEFTATDLTQFLEVQENFRSEIARVSGTPLHYLFITKGDFPSGEAMKSAEARFTRKIVDRQTGFGTTWADMMRLCLLIDGEQDVSPTFKLETVWSEATPYSEREVAESLLMKKALGVPMWQLFKEMGYDEDLVKKMLDNLDPVASPQITSNGQDAALPAALVKLQTPNGPLSTPGQVKTPVPKAPT